MDERESRKDVGGDEVQGAKYETHIDIGGKGKRDAPIKPPSPYYAHSYGGSDFTGRANELAILDEWAALEGKPVMAWVAIGGMGKSALAWHWTQKNAAVFDGLLWWSFYDATFGAFLDTAIEYLSGGKTDPAKLQSGEKVPVLANLLREGRYLLVLDGFERELDAYRGMKAAYQGDTSEDEDTAIGDPRLECIDPQARNFLQAVGALTDLHSKVLITSRLFPNALAGRTGRPLDGVRHEHLAGLQPTDAVTLFQDLGVKGTRAEIQSVCEPLGYHPFSLRLLAGYVVEFEQENRGDIRVAPKYEGLEDDLITRQTHILEVAYGALSKERQQFLGRLAAFRSAMGYGAVTRVVERPESADPASPLTDEEIEALNETLKDLLSRGLLFRDEEGLYDLHPIARRHAYERLTNKESTHANLRDYFSALPDTQIDTEQAKKLEDLLPVIELFHHTMHAGDNDAAITLFRERLWPPMFYRMGVYQTCIELLLPLFMDGENNPPILTDRRSQSWTIDLLASNYNLSGNPLRSIPLYQLGVRMDEELEDTLNLAIALRNLGYQQQITGALTASAANLWRSIALSGEISDERGEAIGYHLLGNTLTHAGSYAEAARRLDWAQEVHERRFEEGRPSNDPVNTRVFRSEMQLLQGNYETALTLAQDAQEWHMRVSREMFPLERDFIRIVRLLGVAERTQGQFPDTEGHLNEALARCRRINLVEFEAVIMLELAHLRRDQKRPDEALELAEEALVIADRSGYRLQQADLHYLLALLAQDRGDTPEAKKHAEKAYERAWCDDDMHYQRTLDQAKTLLGKLDGQGFSTSR